MSKLWLKNLLLVLFVSITWEIKPQVNQANIISTSEGLPSPKVRALHIDVDGYLWIGTENGVVTYKDGLIKPQLVNDSIPFYNCWSISQDLKEGIWFAGYGEGIAYKNENQWRTYTTKNGLISNNTRKLFYHHGKMFVGCDKGIMVMEPGLDVISTIIDSSWLKVYPHVLDFFIYKEEIYAVTNKHGIYLINESNNELQKVNNITPIHGAFLYHDTLIVSNEKYTYKAPVADFFSEETVSSHVALSSYWAFDTTISGRVFTASWGRQEGTGGVYLLDSNGSHSYNEKWGITTNDFRDLAIDKSTNTLYAASMTKGVFAVDLEERIIQYGERNVNQILSTPFGHWVLYNTSLEFQPNIGTPVRFCQSLLKQKARLFNTDYKWVGNKHGFVLGKNQRDKSISLYQLRKSENGVWLNTSIGMFEFNNKGLIVAYLPTHNFVFNVNNSNSIIEAIPYGGVRFISNFKKEDFYDLAEPSIPDNVLDIACFDSTVFFASIFSGLYAHRPSGFVSFKNQSIFPDHKLRKLYKAGVNELWVVTDFGRLYKANIENGFTVFDTIDVSDLYGVTILNVAKYKSHTLVLTNKGLNIIQKNKGVRLLDAEQGLKGDLSGLTVHESAVFVWGSLGYYSLNIEKIINHSVAPKDVRLTKLLVNNESQEITDQLELAYDENALHLTFEVIGFKYPNKLRFQYRLREDQGWSDPTINKFILLPYLNKGFYQIDVRVLDANEGSVNEFTILNAKIKEAFFKSWWFFAITTSMFLALGYLFFARRTNRLLREEQRIAAINFELDKSKMQGLLSRMNPHFLFNALNSIQSFVLNNESERAVSYIGKFARLMRNTLDLSQSLTINLDDEIDYLKSYIEIENLRFGNRVNCKWDIDTSIDLDEIEIPGMVLQPLIENVFVHGFIPSINSPKLLIKISEMNAEYISVKIEDNGIGFDHERVLDESQGIKLIKKRLALLAKEKPHFISIHSKLEEGTFIEIQFFAPS